MIVLKYEKGKLSGSQSRQDYYLFKAGQVFGRVKLKYEQQIAHNRYSLISNDTAFHKTQKVDKIKSVALIDHA